MTKKLILTGCLSALLISTAWAEQRKDASSRPFVVVRRCVERMENLDERSVRVISHVATRSVGLIDRLQENQMPQEAIAAADRSTAHIGEIAKNANEVVDRVLENCLMILREIEAPQIAFDLVNQAAATAKQNIQDAEERALAAIQDALSS